MVSVQCLRVRASTIVWWFKKSDCLRLMSTCPFIDDQASSLYLCWIWANYGYPLGLMALVQLKLPPMLECRLTRADHTTTAGLDVPQDSTPSLRFLHQNQLE
ncbi:hypothetical protein FOXG_18304 [Fusarium oxysporum f. sp. lycopersici 4287]|uniref:Uncharacterized protein n=2 Tax=Fusarium oxysporum TaxID=5507 RepID=A0A0J9UG73_FUSO4|nr:hypothetical protein FOXG_18304 [Fusarium oxysporum f. sp. lycopersici 4287]XP_018235883.1 hypothetical protein FOXG_18304 [Fusarium oxysporum f. sp. lycopersici 4287]XP_018235884.1 hypothetical protein FOXG_18304 [Fusarium oxysporum f. sp. lycopersici 4287]EXK41152.1 hypothetical protein FOMG_04663 [Fusarium oxysporum f. sp. melonis 26406]EXK41153.1 hypothetical protein FOMG_04663 [Fusarium oxysporum f. sp. melonis 26406]KNA97836.1 hypothetical protein FOXG_18304 [Fusarium oxysporum f. sp.